MKLLLDQNLSRRLVAKIAGSYRESTHVADVGLGTASDRAIWEWAGERGYVVVSKDTDFRQLAFLYGPPPKVVWLRVGNVSTSMRFLRHKLLRDPVSGKCDGRASINRRAGRRRAPRSPRT